MSANPEDIDAEVNAALGLEPEVPARTRTPSAAVPLEDEATRAANEVDAFFAGETEDALRAAAITSEKRQPDEHAKALELSKRFGLPADLIERNRARYEQAAIEEDVARALEGAPATREWLANPDHYALAKDDIEHVTGLERYLRDSFTSVVNAAQGFADTARSFVSAGPSTVGGMISGTGSILDTLNNYALRADAALGIDSAAINEALGIADRPWYLTVSGLLGTLGGSFKSLGQDIGPPAERQYLLTDVAQGVGQLGTQVLLGAVGGPTLMTGALFAQGADQQAERAAQMGASGEEVDRAVLMGATITAVTERLGIDALLNRVPPAIKNAVLRKVTDIGLAGGIEAAQEALEGMLQNLTTRATFDPNAPIFEGLEREATAAGGAGAVARAIIMALTPGRQIAAGEVDGQRAAEIAARVNASAMAKRSPEALEALIARIKADTGTDYAYLDAAAFRTLYQTEEEAAAGAAELTGDARTYYEAVAAGIPLAVPLERYVTRVAGSQKAKLLEEHVSFTPDGLTAAQARAAKPDIEARAKALADEDINEARSLVSEAAAVESSPIYQDALGQLLAINTERSAAEAQARLLDQGFRTLAKRSGIDPQVLYDRYRTTIRRDLPEVLTQTPGIDIAIDPLLDQLRAGDIPADQDIFGASLLDFIRSKGGLIDEGGELAARDVDVNRRAFERNLIQPETGRTLDDLAEAAVEAGYLTERDPNVLLDAIDRELRGDPVFALGNENRELLDRREMLSTLQGELERAGVDLGTATNAQAREALRRAVYDQLQEQQAIWMSALTRAAETAKREKGTAAEWLGTIRNTPGVKAEEIEWSGLEAWLGSLGRQATRDEVTEYLRANEVRVEEVIRREQTAEDFAAGARIEAEVARLVDELQGQGYLATFEDDGIKLDFIRRDSDQQMFEWFPAAGGQPSPTLDDRWLGEELGEDGELERLPPEINQLANRLKIAANKQRERVNEGENNLPRYRKYTTPGGENYRELLLTLPPPRDADLPKVVEHPSGEGFALRYSDGSYVRSLEGGRSRARASAVDASRWESRELARYGVAAHDPARYRGSHWNEPNVLAHLRFDERTDTDGKRVMHIAEVQSDWHQEGRKKGYQSTDVAKRASEFEEYSKELAAKYRLNPAHNLAMYARLNNISDAEVAKYEALQSAWVAAKNGVPDAPFKTTWPELAMKRAIRYAADNGFDRITWDTGEVNAERYDLSKHISEIKHEKAGEGLYEVMAFNLVGDKVFNEDEITIERVEEVLGKEIAEKIAAGEGSTEGGGYRDWRTLSGLDLKVGGEGMRAFYDKILPATVNKYVKKWGGKVGTTGIDTGRKELTKYQVLRPDGTVYGEYSSAADAEAGAERAGGTVKFLESGTATPVHSLDITPSMRAAALRGQMLFQSAYHGTPHDVDRFSLEKIGTGEGVQAYGWGLYFAENKGVANSYRTSLSGRPRVLVGGRVIVQPVSLEIFDKNRPVEGSVAARLSHRAQSDVEMGRTIDVEKVIDAVRDDIDRSLELAIFRKDEGVVRSLSSQRDALDEMQQEGIQLEQRGALYEVEIPDEAVARFLDWDKPLKDQTPEVREALNLKESDPMDVRRDNEAGVWMVVNAKTGERLSRWAAKEDAERVANTLHSDVKQNTSGEWEYRELVKQLRSQRAASEYLRSIGILGIRYKDAGSRGAKDGTRNLVVFDDSIITITKKNDQPLAPTLPTDTPAFKRWFGDSKVVDAKGKPLVVYHGTTADFDEFDKSKLGSKTRALDARKGFFFTSSGKAASEFTWQSGQMTGNVMPVYLSMQDPLIVDLPGEWLPGKYDETLDRAKSAGYDGVIFRGVTTLDTPGDYYIVFQPTQIKSAIGNTGAFNADDPRILYQSYDPAPIYYSSLLRAIEDAKLNKAPASQWLGTLKNAARVSTDEIEWLGLEEWLNEQPGSITKEAVAEYVRAHQVTMLETVYAGGQKVDTSGLIEELNGYIGTFADWASEGDEWHVMTEPSADDFTLSVTMSDEDAEDGESEVEIDVEIGRFYAKNSEDYRSGDFKVRVNFPYGTEVDVLLDYDMEAQYGRVVTGAEFDKEGLTREEIDAVEEVIDKIELTEGEWELNDALANDSAAFDEKLQETIEHLKSGQIADAKESIDAAARIERVYGGTQLPTEHEVFEEGSVPFAEYVMKGDATDYSVVLLQLPLKIDPAKLEFGKTGQGLDKATYEGVIGYGLTREAALADLKGKMLIESRSSRDMFVKSSHFEERNVLAHARFNERVDQDGTRVLFIEEIQSDWHQKGREDGYRAPEFKPVTELPAGWMYTSIEENEVTEIALYDDQGKRVASQLVDPRDERAAPEINAVNLYNSIQKQQNDAGVPDAPFKSSAAWSALAMKRMIRYAAERGIDRIAWTNGAQQDRRWNLAERVSSIRYHPITQKLEAYDHGNTRVVNETVPPEKLRDYVGESRAKALLEQAERFAAERAKYSVVLHETEPAYRVKLPDGSWYGPAGGTPILFGSKDAANTVIDAHVTKRAEVPLPELTGGDIAKGDSLAPFYDRVLPQATQKFIKRFGGKVGATAIDFGEDGIGTVPAFDLTPSLKEAALAGLPLFQRVPDTAGKRGSFSITRDRRATISLFEAANLSTFLHESGHFFLEVLADLAQEPYAPQTIRDDFNTALKWMGVSSREEIGVEQHEQFARGFEAYLREGKAPTVELQGLFSRFRAWLVGVYRSIKQLRVELTPEITRVFDRLLATEEEIAASERTQNYAAIFTDAETAGLSPESWKAYRELLGRAHEEAVEDLSQQFMREMSRENRTWWREQTSAMRETVRAEVNATPLYQALAYLQRGTEADGSPLPESVTAAKLSRTALVERYGEAFLKRLPRPYVYTREGGLHPDAIASLFGYGSGDELIEALANARPKEALIRAEADRRMREQYGDMLNDGTLADKALMAVHSQAREQVLARELAALNRKRRQVEPFVRAATRAAERQERQAREANAGTLPDREELAAIKLAAQRIMQAKKVRDIRPDTYRRAEAKAARAAFEAASKKDYERAYLEKRRQMLNFELYKEATSARARADRMVRYLKGMGETRARERLAKARGQYLDQVQALLARFDFGRVTRKAAGERAALAAWVAEQEAQGKVISVPEYLLDEARRTPYPELMFAEIEGLYDAVRNIEHLARTKNRMLAAKEAKEWQDAKQDLETRIRQQRGGNAPPASRFELSEFEEFKVGVHGHTQNWRRPEFIIEQLDGGDSGPWHDYFWEPANRAEYERERLREEVLLPLHAITATMTKERRAELHESVFIKSLGRSFNRRTLISIALNMGNASNMERLLKGGFRDETRGNAVTKLTPRALEEIKNALNPADLDFMQATWNTVESLWPKVVAFNKRMGGITPEKITPTPLVTKHGTVTGGYWPAVRDPLASKVGASQAEESDPVATLMGANFTRVATGKSHLKERTGAGGPLLLDFEQVLGRHIEQVLTDLTHREFVLQAMRILDDGKLRLAIQDVAGEVAWDTLRGMVRSAVRQDGGFNAANNWLQKFGQRVLSNTAVAALGFRATTALGNLVLAPIQAAARVSPTFLLQGLGRFYSNHKASADFVHERSPMMKTRFQNLDNTFRVVLEELQGKRGMRAKVAQAAMSIHRAADYLATHGIWLGRYEQALAAGESEAEAARLADKAIRTTQTAGAPKDLSAFESDPRYQWAKLFLGPMLIMGNQLREAAKKRGVVKTWPQAFGVMTAAWFLPAVMWDIVTGAASLGDDEDGDDRWIDDLASWALKKVFFYPFMTMPFYRDVASIVERQLAGKPAEPRMMPLADSAYLVAKAGLALAKETGDWMDGDEFEGEKAVRAGARALGPLTGIPTNQIDVTSTFLWDVYTGRYEPQGAGDFRYLMIRRPRDED